MMQGLRYVASQLEVHIKWFGRRCNAGIEIFSISTLRRRPNHFICTSGRKRNAAQILASYYKPALRLRCVHTFDQLYFKFEYDYKKMIVLYIFNTSILGNLTL